MIVLGENNCAFVDAWIWDLMACMDGWMDGRMDSNTFCFLVSFLSVFWVLLGFRHINSWKV